MGVSIREVVFLRSKCYFYLDGDIEKKRVISFSLRT